MHKNNKFTCQRCGNCCLWSGYVRLQAEEIEDIAAFLGLDEREFTNHFTRLTADRRGLSLIERENGSCIFFSSNPPSCQINQVKPQQCRDFPLRWSFFGWEKECAGMVQG